MLKKDLLKELADLKYKCQLNQDIFDLEYVVSHLYDNYKITPVDNQVYVPLVISQFLLDRVPTEHRKVLLNEIIARLQEDIRNYLTSAHYDPHKKIYVVSGSY